MQFPLLSRSGVLQRMISEYQPPAGGGGGGMCTLQLDDIPGGAKAFELAAKFCYDVKIELNALNVVCLRCAAEYLRMTDDYAEGNLITQAESFLADVLANWKDSIKALETCEGVLPTAEDLHLVSRCITALASRACNSDAAAPLVRNAGVVVDKDALWNGIRSGDTASAAAAAASGMDWWYEDVSFLSLPMFKRLIQAMEAKGMRAESIAGAIMFYAGRFLPGLKRDTSFSNALASYGADGAGGGGAGGMSSRNITPRAASVSAPSEGDQRYFLEEIVALLPTKKGVASTKFLLGMLRKAMLLHASPLCRENLERRIGAQLEDASLDDLLVPNLGYHVETLYDIDCVQRILDYFMSSTDGIGTGYTSPALAEDGGGSLGIPQGGTPSSSLSPITMVAKLMDGFLAEVAPDTNLKLPKFQALAAVVPDYARPVDDGIYRATDIYLKVHMAKLWAFAFLLVILSACTCTVRISVAPVAVRIGEGAAVPAAQLPEAVAGGVHARGAERAAAASGGGAGALLRAAPPAHVHRRVVLRVRQRGGGRRRAPTLGRRHRPQGRRGHRRQRASRGRR
jgi:hypothetical protein